MEPIYLDNNATTRCDPAVVEAMLPFFTEHFGNASSIHAFGSEVGKALKKARSQVQALLGAEHDSEIIFTSCGTESDSTAILSALKAQPERNTVITTNVEHPAILTLCEWLEKEGYIVHKLKVDKKGRIDMDEYKSMLHRPRGGGFGDVGQQRDRHLFPVEEMAELANAKGIMFHTDAVQAVGKIPIDLKNTKIDMLSLSGHKLHAPKGIGVLYLRRNCRFRPLLRGGHQERGRAPAPRTGVHRRPRHGLRTGTEQMEFENTEVKRLRDKLEQGILSQSALLPDRRCEQPSAQHQQHRFRIHRRRGDPAAAEQDGHRRQFRFRLYLGLARTLARDARDGHSLHRRPRHHSLLAVGYNTEAEVDRVIEAVPPIVAQLRKLSPYWTDKGPAANPEAAFAPTYA
jgi:cysteine desulfurase